MKILVTGFEAFLGESINPSQLLLQNIAGTEGVDTLLLPVAFDQAFPILKAQLARQSYDFVVLLGQAGKRAHISLERIAINWRETEVADNDGLLADPGHLILPEAEKAYFSGLPIDHLRGLLQAENIPVEISYSAGAYVCNDLFFKLSHWLHQTGSFARGGFIHVPFLPEQVLEKPGVPSMEFAEMLKAVQIILRGLALEV